MEKLTVTRKQAKQLIAATFPDYTGRKIKVEFTKSVCFSDLNWGGGTRNEYAAVASDGRVVHGKTYAPWSNPIEGKIMDMPKDAIVVEHSIFCGHDLGLTIYAHPMHAPKWLR